LFVRLPLTRFPFLFLAPCRFVALWFFVGATLCGCPLVCLLYGHPTWLPFRFLRRARACILPSSCPLVSCRGNPAWLPFWLFCLYGHPSVAALSVSCPFPSCCPLVFCRGNPMRLPFWLFCLYGHPSVVALPVSCLLPSCYPLVFCSGNPMWLPFWLFCLYGRPCVFALSVSWCFRPS